MFHHRRSVLFPVVLIGLTAVLVLAVLFATKPSPVPPSVLEAPPITDADYQANMGEAVGGFEAKYAQAETDIARLVVVEDALASVLAVRVPAEEKSLHLELAMSLNQLKDALRSGEGMNEALERTKHALARYSAWQSEL